MQRITGSLRDKHALPLKDECSTEWILVLTSPPASPPTEYIRRLGNCNAFQLFRTSFLSPTSTNSALSSGSASLIREFKIRSRSHGLELPPDHRQIVVNGGRLLQAPRRRQNLPLQAWKLSTNSRDSSSRGLAASSLLMSPPRMFWRRAESLKSRPAIYDDWR